MGSMVAAGMADEVQQGLDLSVALHHHLRYNHYPPLPDSMMDVAEQAIELVAGTFDEFEVFDREPWDEEIDMPEGILFRGNATITAAEAIEAMHLDCFLVPNTEEDDE